jgi:hypothetical protein
MERLNDVLAAISTPAANEESGWNQLPLKLNFLP